MLWQVLLVCLIIWYACSLWNRRRLFQLAKKLKNDFKYFPFIGHAYIFFGDSTAQMETMMILGREAIKHGGLTYAWLGTKLYIVAADIDVIDVVLKNCLEKEEILTKCGRVVMDNGSLIASVPIWRPRRKIMLPKFNHNILKHYVEIFSKQSDILVTQLKQAPKDTFPIWDYLVSYSVNTISESMLGYKLDGQQTRSKSITDAIDKLLKLLSKRLSTPWLYPTPIYHMTSDYTGLMGCKEELNNFIGEVINIKKKVLENKTEAPIECDKDEIKSILDILVETNRGLSYTELQEELRVLVVAGVDTSTTSSCFTALLLSRHPDVQDKVYQEVLEVIGDTDRPIVAEDLPKLKYLDAVIKESLRFYPPVPLIGRIIDKDITLPSGVTLVKGCNVNTLIWAVHRNPKYWGPDPDEFRPERFFLPYDPKTFMAFSYGPRNCVGSKAAMMSMTTMLATLVRHFRLLPALVRGPDGEMVHKPIKTSFHIMMKDVDNGPVRLEPRM